MTYPSGLQLEPCPFYTRGSDGNLRELEESDFLESEVDRWMLPADVRSVGDTQRVRYDSPSAWDNGRNCSGTYAPGVKELGQFILAKFPGVARTEGYNCRPNTANKNQTSVHGVGRALDIVIPMQGGRANSAVGDPIANWLVRNATDIGVQYIIWNRVAWNGSGNAPNNRPYAGPVPHTDHIHVELNQDGAGRKTPWFQKSTGVGPVPPPSYKPSPTRIRFEDAVARKDWREAFLNLNGLNMYEMLRALNGLSNDWRGALMQQRQNFRGMVNMPRIEYALAVVQNRQLPPVAPGDLAATGQVQTAIEFLQAPATDWARVRPNDRLAYVMRRLIQNYGYPENAAAGLVGNLWAESGLIPNRIEGSLANTPMRSQDFNGQMANFTAGQIMNRNSQRRQGPKLPGIGLAQWTEASRRIGLFRHSYRGRQLGADILFNMDAQIDYLVNELKDKYRGVHNLLMMPNVSVEAASDEVVYSFETPGAILGQDPVTGRRIRLPRNDPRVQKVFGIRRKHSTQALQTYRQSR